MDSSDDYGYYDGDNFQSQPGSLYNEILSYAQEYTEDSPAEEGTVVDDQDQYREAYWKLASFVYQNLKETEIFDSWYHEQFNCQFGQCAFCREPIERSDRTASVAHIIPEIDFGTNYANNLVLAHPSCHEYHITDPAPLDTSWIKPNQYSQNFNEVAWQMLKTAQKDYPDYVPLEFCEEPSVDNTTTNSSFNLLDL